jgi:hypothetical protein
MKAYVGVDVWIPFPWPRHYLEVSGQLHPQIDLPLYRLDMALCESKNRSRLFPEKNGLIVYRSKAFQPAVPPYAKSYKKRVENSML